MEVRCSNCATEYEFDDALVSARGTSVKCTNCGHQFRVHPTTASPTVPEKWVVRDAQKRETTFTSLRDLQQAIVKGQLSPQHQLSHGGQAFRALEDIFELQTFFSAARQRPPDRPAPRTLLGVGRDGLPLAASRDGQPPGAAREGQPPRPSAPPPRKRPTDPPQERVTPVAGMPFNVRGISLADGLTVEQFERRNRLLNEVDNTFKGVETTSRLVDGLDQFAQQAYAVISSPRARRAFGGSARGG